MKKYFFVLPLLAMAWSVWYLLRPNYKFTKYQLSDCSENFTLVEYFAYFKRGFVIVAGDYNTQEIPTSNCITLPEMNGISPYYEFIATCEDKHIVINFRRYISNQTYNSSKIFIKKVDGEQYQNMRDHGVGTLIKLF
ncbi:hypothetical protein [Hymenobacter coccineus]|uniref:hypothetical protein n=1 Tax=Hymenobacter coccineus TaxID=1908235 RepID=UPI000F7B7A30|nr:hypothetical protein [Hymenobacter coccineus]